MQRVRWVLIGIAIAFAFAAAIRSARMHGTGLPEPVDAAVGRPVAENRAERLTGEPPPPSARRAPEFPRSDADGWINSPPLSMSGLRGKVVLLDVWTYG
ncbi:MAG TPA: hypothetical protein VFD06_05380 [Candidatus Polarisedimenticolia bacterium]|nr:hypothetical protein [Candidatus Polarisedimenticolia bacterium]